MHISHAKQCLVDAPVRYVAGSTEPYHDVPSARSNKGLGACLLVCKGLGLEALVRSRTRHTSPVVDVGGDAVGCVAEVSEQSGAFLAVPATLTGVSRDNLLAAWCWR